MDVDTLPENPALQAHPVETLRPLLFAGQVTTAHEELKNGVDVIAVTLPENPAMHMHPAGTLFPILKAGHDTGAQKLTKKGAMMDAATAPVKPALQEQPAGALTPALLAGQPTAVHELLKNGAPSVGELGVPRFGVDVTPPEKPGLQAQPITTLTPLLFTGHATAMQEEL